MRARLSFELRKSCATFGEFSTSFVARDDQVRKSPRNGAQVRAQSAESAPTALTDRARLLVAQVTLVTMAMEPALLELLDGALSSLAPEAQAMCDGDGILRALKANGIFRVSDLVSIITTDFDGFKATLPRTPLLFLVRLKTAALALQPAASPAASPLPPTAPAGAAFQTPTAPPPPAAPLVDSVVVSVKVGPKALVTARVVSVASTTSFAELLSLAIAGESAAEREKLAVLPVKVLTYTGPQHLSAQMAEPQLSSIVATSVSIPPTYACAL